MINQINVFLRHQNTKHFVGRLAYSERSTYFEYDGAFIQQGIEISPYKLPLKAGVQKCDNRIFDGLFGVFADSLPDGWGKLLIDRHLSSIGINFRSITPLDRLSYIGSYGVGALSYEPCTQAPDVKEERVDLDRLAMASMEILEGQSEALLDTLLAVAGSSAGARPKAMVQIDRDHHILHGQQTLRAGYEHYIVKFPNSSDTAEAGKVEYIYSLMAKDAGIHMPETKLLYGNKNSYFAIKRFDRAGDNPVHMHSVAGLVHSDFRLPSLDYDDLLMLGFHLTKDINELHRMYRLACFNLFSHNRDDHAKNFSFLLKDRQWRLSPAYDLTFSNGPGGEHSTTYTGEGRNPTEKHLLELAKKHGVKEAQTIIDEVRSALNSFQNYAKKLGLSRKMTHTILENQSKSMGN